MISVCSGMLGVEPRESRSWISGGEEQEGGKDESTTESASRVSPAGEVTHSRCESEKGKVHVSSLH